MARKLYTAAVCGLMLAAASPSGVHGLADSPAAVSDTLRVTLSAPKGGTVAEGATGHFEASVAGSTADGAVTIRYSVSGTAVADQDYAALSGEATVAQGESAARIALEAFEDGILDKGETVVLALTGATGPGTVVVDQTAATATIADDGSMTVSLTAVPDTISEGSAWRSTVTMSTPVADRVSVRWRTTDGTALAGRDYTAADEVLSFQPGETSKSISVQTLEDDNSEAVEVFYVSLDPPSISASAATIGALAVNGDARSAFIECSIRFPPDVQTLFRRNDPVSAGTLIGTVAAEASAIADYFLTGRDNKFTINARGQIRTTAALDAGALYELAVTAVDHCDAKATIDVTVIVNSSPQRVGTIPDTTVEKGKSGSVDVSSYFSDPDNNPLTYTATSSKPSVVGVSVVGSTVTYTGETVGSARVTVTATDPGGLSATQSFVVTVTQPNRSPTPRGTIKDRTVEVGNRGLVDVSSKFDDQDDDKLTYTATSSDMNVVSVGVDGSNVTYEGLSKGSATVTVRATDPGGLFAEQTFTVTVPNRPPTVAETIPDGTVHVERTGSVGLLSKFDDPDGDKLTHTAVSSAPDVVSVNVDGSNVKYTGESVGSADVTVRATDRGGLFVEQTFTVTVPNRPPRGVETIKPQSVHVGESGSVVVSSKFDDPDGDKLTFKAASLDRKVVGVSMDGSTVEYVGAGVGRAFVTVMAMDPGGLEATQSFVVTVPNRPPTTKGTIRDRTIKVGESESVDVTSKFDEPDGDALTYAAESSEPTVVSVSFADGEVTYEGLKAGSTTVTVTARDPGSLSATQSFEVTVEKVNQRPTARAGRDQWVEEGDVVKLDGSRSSDPDGTIEQWRWTGPLTLTNPDSAKARFTAPAVDTTTAYTFTLKVWDDDDATDTDLMKVTVEPDTTTTCTAPIANAGTDRTVREQQRVTLDGSRSTGESSYAWKQVGGRTVALSDADTDSPWFDTPLVPADEVLTFRLTVKSDCDTTTDTDDVRVTIRDNRAPEPKGTIPSQPVRKGESGTVSVSGYFRDPDGDALTYAATSSATGVASVSVTGSTVKYTGKTVGNARVTVTARDRYGATAKQEFRVTVSDPPPTNRAPRIESAIPAREVVAGDSAAVRVSAHFSDPDSDALTYSASSSNRNFATVSASNDTVWVKGVSKGSADITVTAADPRGLSVSQDFKVTVSQGNAAPEVVSAIPAMAFPAGDSMVVDVSPHFRDPDGDALTYEGQSSNEAAATVRVNGSKLTVTGASPGESQVTVTARDAHGASVSQAFTVRVVNEAPVVLKPIPAMTLAPAEYALVELSEHFSDATGDDLKYGAASLDEGVATVQVREDRLTVTGVLRGHSPVTVTAKDEYGASVSLEFVVTVPNRAPERLGTIPDRTIERGDTASVAVPGHFVDPEGDTLTYTAVSSDGDVLAVGMAGDRARYEGLRKGVARVTVTADDGHGGRADQEFVVTVEGANGPPEVASAIPALTVARGGTAVVDASPHFRDPDGDTLRYEASSSNEAAATVGVSGSDVTVTGVSRGETRVTVTARDPEGASVSQAFLVTVPNSPPVAAGSLDPLTLDHGTSALVEVSRAFSDPDGDGLAYRASSSDGNVVHVAVRGSQVAVNALKRGDATVTVTADDGHGGTAEQAFEVTVRNAAPRFSLPAYEREVAEHADAGTAVGEPVTAFDTGGDALTYSFAGRGGGSFGIVAASGQITVAGGAAPDYERGDTLHAVRVVASDGALADTVGVTIRVTDVPPPGKPDAPAVAGGTEEVSVSWSAPENEGPEITDYDLRYRAQGNSDWTDVSALGAVLTHKITGLEPGTAYQVQVRAENSEGAGEWSEPGEGTTEPDNRAPSFDAEAYEREVAENSAPGTEVGAPVTATDDDQDDLTYTLVTGGDEALFEIDGTTGQIKVAEGAALDYESGDKDYAVTVRASDGTLAATAAVTIRVTDVPAPGKPDAPTVTGGTEQVEVSWSAPPNEGPAITGYDYRYRAKSDGDWSDPARLEVVLARTITGLKAGTAYQVQVRAVSSEGAGDWSDPGEGTTDAPPNRAPVFDMDAYEREVAENSPAGTAVGDPVTATDADDLTYSFLPGGEVPFEIGSASGRITVAEDAALNYESADTLFTVSVEANDGTLADTASVTIRVTNADDPGTVALDPEVARVGVEMTATLTDEDGVRGGGTSRKWQRSANGSAWNDVGRGRMYNPVTSDAGRWLRVVFTYSDRHGPGKRAVSAALKVQPGNAAPSFVEDAYEREVPENSPGGTAVGEPVTATDGDNDDLTYAFVPGGAEVPFEIDGQTGRITVAEDAALNYESADTLFTVRVEASDGTLADTASVTIRVKNADDPGEVTLSPDVARVGVELTATLTDEDGVRNAGRQRRWQRSRNGNSWNEVGRGRMYNPVTADEGKWLRVAITYSDGHGPGKRAVSAAVKVLSANARPSFGAVYEREVPENSPAGTKVGAPVAATDPDGNPLSYGLVTGGDDEALFGIGEATGQITVAGGAALDYESGDTLLAVRVVASDGELADTASVTIRVTNADDPGKIALSADVARVGVRLTATLTDQDRSVERSKMRTWQRSPNGAAWTMVVQGAERRFYTPTEADRGKYLRAVFTYRDGHGPGKRAESPAVMVVGATTPVVSFGAESYTAAPGGSADVAVLLSPAASSALAIKVVAGDSARTVAFQTGASAGALSVTTAGLSVGDTLAVRFGDLPEGVAVGVPATTRIVLAAAAGDRVSRSVVEDGSLTELEVAYARAEYAAVAGGPGTEITLRMSPTADRRVAVPLTGSHAVSFEAALPDSVVFEPGDSLAAFVLEVPVDTEPGCLALGFGALPEAVSAGAVASATVDIADHDPGPLRDEAFDLGLAVFGRAVAEGARQAVGARIDAVMRPAGSSSGTGVPGSSAEWAGRAAGTLASLTGAPLNASSAADMARRSGSVDLPTGREVVRRLLPSLSFATALGPQSVEGRSRLGLWAEGSAQSFRGDPGIDYDGGLRALTVGADARIGSSALLGVSLMRSDGDLDYEHRSTQGSLGHAMNSVHPYLFLQPSPGIGLWAMAGYGGGDVRDGDLHGDTGASLRMLSGGVRVPLARSGAFGLALNGDAFTVGMSAEDGGREGTASRARALLEASWAAGGLKLATQAGARYDGGDADTGGGAETGALVGYAGHGLDLDLRGRLALGSGRHREWGAALRLAFDPGTRGEGFRLAVSPKHGHDRSGLHGFMDGGRLHAMTPATGRDWRLDAEAGYGIGNSGAGGALDSYTRLSADGRNRSWSFGTRYSVSQTLRLGVEGSRNQMPGQDPNLGLKIGVDLKF